MAATPGGVELGDRLLERGLVVEVGGGLGDPGGVLELAGVGVEGHDLVLVDLREGQRVPSRADGQM